MRRHVTFLLFLYACISATQVFADTEVLYPSNRLSSGLITCICQDAKGYLWVGTEYGLNKFDGYRFTTYLHSRTDSTTITNNEIASLYVDSKGQLWVGCSRGLARYDYARDCFTRFHFPDHHTPHVSTMAETQGGKLLIGTAGYGLYSVNSNGHIDYESRFNHQRTDHFYYRLHTDREGHLWASNHKASINKFTLSHEQPVALDTLLSSYGSPVCYIEHSPQQMLIVCMHGILAYDYRTHTVDDAGFDLTALDGNTSLNAACQTDQGNIYIATQGEGLLKIAKGSRQLTRIPHSNRGINLNTAQMVDLMADNHHHLWAACYNKGLIMQSHASDPFATWSLSAQQYVTGGGVSSIAPGNGNTTWCVVQNGGAYCFDSAGVVIAHRTLPPGARMLYRSKNGQYWLTTENILYRYDPETGRATPELTLSGRGLNCLCEDATGQLYLCTFGMGLYVYNPVTRYGYSLTMTQTNRKGGYLCNDWIKAMMLDSRGLLWICTTSGISMLQPSDSTFNSRGWNALLEGVQCYSVCETADGDMLFGTENGLFRYDWKRNKVHKLVADGQMDNKMICAMVTDTASHTVWMSTNHGLWQYHPDRDSLVSHLGHDGLTTREFIPGAVLYRGTGPITFGTADGLVAFRPEAVATHVRRLPKPILTHISASGQTLNPQETHYILPSTDNSLTMEFSLLDYNNAENISFQYRINGSKHWVDNGEGHNQLTFHQLNYGEYLIEMRAAAGRLVSAETITLRVTILAPWYLSTWAYVAYGLLIAILGGLTAFSWNRYIVAKRMHLRIIDLKQNMHWLRSKFFGSLEERGKIQQVKVKGNNDALMERILKCVNENLANPDFSVEMLTHEVGISRSHLHRKMKEMTGLSTAEFVRNLRLEQGSRLIREKKINITQVAYAVGFNNQAHFSTVFKKYYGMTPTEYAEKNSR